MFVQPLDYSNFKRPTEFGTCWLTDNMLLHFVGLPAVPTEAECRHEIGFSFANTVDQRGRDCGGPSAQNKPVARWLDGRADHGEIVEQIVGDVHISASAPGGTAPSSASGIGPIGLMGAVGAVPSGRSVLSVLCPVGPSGAALVSA
jgi:hypothetical protein